MDPNQQQQQQHQFNLPPGFNLQAANNLGRAPPQQAQQPSHLPTQQLSNPIPSIRGGVQRHGTQEVWSALQRMVEMGGQPNPQMLSQMSQLLSNNGIQTQGFPQQQQMQQFQNANNPQFQQAMSQQMQQQPFPGMPNMPQGMPNNMNVGGNHPQGSMQQQQNIAQMFQLGMGQQQGQGQQPQQQQQQQIPPQLMQAAQMQQNGFQMPMQQHMQQQPQQQQQQGQPADPHMAELLNEQQQQNGGLTQQMLKSLTANDIAALKGMNPAQRASYIGLRFANQPMPPQNAQSTSQQQPPPGLPQQMQQQAQMNNQFQQFMTPQQANRGMQQQAPQQQQQQQQPPNQPMPMPMPQQSQLQNQQNNEERIRLLNQQKAQAHQALVAAMNPASNMDPTVRMRLLAKFGQQPLQQQPQQQPPQQQQTQPPPPQAQQMQQPQQQIQQQQQQAMMQMLNQPGSGMPMPPIAMKPQQSQNMGGMLPGPPGGDSAAGPGPENVQLAQPMEDVSVPRLSAQLQKEHQEAQMLVRQWQQIQQLPQEQQQSPAAMQVKSALMNKQRRIQMISRLIKSKNEQRPSSGMPVNPPGPGDQNGGTPGMPMANNGLVPPNMAHAASQSPNQARTGPSPSVPQQPMGQPQAMSQMNVPQQPPPTVQAQQQFMLRNQLQPSNAGAQGQRLPQGSLNNSMNNPAFENQPNMAMAMNVPQQQRQQQQQQPPPPPPQQQMMGVINAQSKQPMQPQAAQVAQSATPQALQMQAQQHAQDMQRLQAPTPGLPQQQNPVNGQPMMQPNQRNVEANNNLLDYIVNAKTLTDAQVDHMRVLMPFWTEKDKFVPMARALRENLTRPCPKPEFIERWMRYARARHDILHKTFTFPGAELLKVDGADMNIYDFYTLLVGVRAFGKQVAASLDFYASAGIRVGVPPQPGQQRCSLNAAQTLKAFTDLALAPIHNQIMFLLRRPLSRTPPRDRALLAVNRAGSRSRSKTSCGSR
ncbi:hypothetical protein CALCODRAFT_297452 [Calocera cornea HHB12733]|uniref:Uncharacterized protein n=1 Tax=Calocera cornea HHB12733 TaxID=1353952 RepID=A0A165FM06_9BASI|nr:hypothetical protein CALCODRAFT_297452 [Calocera cornea HHB12733]